MYSVLEGSNPSPCIFLIFDEINIILHIIDIESNLYITQKYKKLDSKLKEKDKWIYYDEYGWGNLVPRNEKEFNKEEFINEFTYAYEDI